MSEAASEAARSVDGSRSMVHPPPETPPAGAGHRPHRAARRDTLQFWPMSETIRGHLGDPEAAPERGERVEAVALLEGVAIEHILSGVLSEPLEYCQDHDEWVLLLQGSAELDVDGERVPMRDGDWMVLGAGVAHRLVTVEPGSRWLAVRVPIGRRAEGT